MKNPINISPTKPNLIINLLVKLEQDRASKEPKTDILQQVSNVLSKYTPIMIPKNEKPSALIIKILSKLFKNEIT